jgi:hypothetical protein
LILFERNGTELLVRFSTNVIAPQLLDFRCANLKIGRQFAACTAICEDLRLIIDHRTSSRIHSAGPVNSHFAARGRNNRALVKKRQIGFDQRSFADRSGG